MMLGEEFKEMEIDQPIFSSNLFQVVLQPEEQKNDVGSLQLSSEGDQNRTKSINRGKGRPKGQKNSKNKERKAKDSAASENRRRGHWSNEENKRYHWFLEIYHQHFICKEMRRLDKIFKTMATFIGSREAEQCRSHHQKMEKKYRTFPQILLFLRRAHYSTEETNPIYEDLQLNQIQEQAELIEPKKLIMLGSQDKSIPATPETVLKEVDIELNNAHKDFGMMLDPSLDDLLGDHYEMHLDLDDLLL